MLKHGVLVLIGACCLFLCSSSDEESLSGSVIDAQEVPQRSLLDNIILALWQEREELGLFRCVAGV